MARNTHLYNSVMRKINADPWFLDLPPLAQWLWLRLLTGRHVTAVPGLWSASESGLAADLHIGKRRLRTLLGQLCDVPYSDGTRRLYLDNAHQVLWLPKNIAQPCNQPDNEFVVRGWIPHLEMVTDCELKDIAVGEFRGWIDAHQQRFPNGVPEDFPVPRTLATRDRLPRPSQTPSARPSTETVSQTVSPEPEKTLDAYARAREKSLDGELPHASFEHETDPNLVDTDLVRARNGSKPCRDETREASELNRERSVLAGEFSTNQPESPTSLGRQRETVSQTVEGGVSHQDQDQDQDLKQTLPKDLTGCRETAPSASGGHTRKPAMSSGLTPAERCERSFTHPNAAPATAALFEAWRSESGKINARMDQRWRELFDRLVYDGVTIEEVIRVVKGAKLDEWASKQVHLDPAAILGSAGQRLKYSAKATAADEEAAAIRRRRLPTFSEPERVLTAEERAAQAADAQRALEEFERGQRGGRRLAKANARPSEPNAPAESGTVPIALIASVPPPKSEGELLAEYDHKREQARQALASFDDEGAGGELPPVLEA